MSHTHTHTIQTPSVGSRAYTRNVFPLSRALGGRAAGRGIRWAGGGGLRVGFTPLLLFHSNMKWAPIYNDSERQWLQYTQLIEPNKRGQEQVVRTYIVRTYLRISDLSRRYENTGL